MTPLPVLLAVAMLATGKPAPKLSPDAPLSVPPPANLTQDEVRSWMAKYVRAADEWTLLAYDYEGVKLLAGGGVRRSAEGWAETSIRTELFKPVTLKAGVTARSGIARWSVDCKAGLLAVRHMVVYAGNNLEGELATRETDEAIWQEPVGSEAEAIKGVCKAMGK